MGGGVTLGGVDSTEGDGEGVGGGAAAVAAGPAANGAGDGCRTGGAGADGPRAMSVSLVRGCGAGAGDGAGAEDPAGVASGFARNAYQRSANRKATATATTVPAATAMRPLRNFLTTAAATSSASDEGAAVTGAGR